MQVVGCYFYNEQRLFSCLPPKNKIFWGVYLAFSPEDVFESSHTWMEAETAGGTGPGNLLWLMRRFLFEKKKNKQTEEIQYTDIAQTCEGLGGGKSGICDNAAT